MVLRLREVRVRRLCTGRCQPVNCRPTRNVLAVSGSFWRTRRGRTESRTTEYRLTTKAMKISAGFACSALIVVDFVYDAGGGSRTKTAPRLPRWQREAEDQIAAAP